MTDQDIKEKIYGIASKLENIAGHYAMIESLYKDTYNDMKLLGIEEEYSGSMSDAEGNYDFECLSCEIQNNEDEIFEKIITRRNHK